MRWIMVMLLAGCTGGCGGAFPDNDIRVPFHPHIQADRPSPLAQFAALDTNGDGVLERAEAEGHWTEIFEMMNVRGDGRLSLPEFMALPSPLMTVREPLMEMNDGDRYAAFQRLDRRQRGWLGLDDVLDSGPRMFDILDRNHDGVLSKEELGIPDRPEPPANTIAEEPPPPPRTLPRG